MTGMTSEMDRRANLPARGRPTTWLDDIERPPRTAEPRTAVQPPAPGVAVLACRCGAVLDLADMRRQPIGCRTATIAAITCGRCS